MTDRLEDRQIGDGDLGKLRPLPDLEPARRPLWIHLARSSPDSTRVRGRPHQHQAPPRPRHTPRATRTQDEDAPRQHARARNPPPSNPQAHRDGHRRPPSRAPTAPRRAVVHTSRQLEILPSAPRPQGPAATSGSHGARAGAADAFRWPAAVAKQAWKQEAWGDFGSEGEGENAAGWRGGCTQPRRRRPPRGFARRPPPATARGGVV